MQQNRVVSDQKERLFFKVHLDMWDSDLLSPGERFVFLALKRYADVRVGEGEVFPTVEEICKKVGMAENTVRKHLRSLKNKGIIDIKRRGLSKSNLYVIRDKAKMWKSSNVEELQTVAKETREEEAIRYLQEKGYTITKKEKESGLFAKNTNTTNKPDSKTTYTKSKGQKGKSQGKPNKFHNFDQSHFYYI